MDQKLPVLWKIVAFGCQLLPNFSPAFTDLFGIDLLRVQIAQENFSLQKYNIYLILLIIYYFITMAHSFITEIYNKLSYICVFFKSQDKFWKYYLKLWGYDIEGIYDLQEGLLEGFISLFFIP